MLGVLLALLLVAELRNGMQLANIARRHPGHRHRRAPARGDPRRQPHPRARRPDGLRHGSSASSKGGGRTRRSRGGSARRSGTSRLERKVERMRRQEAGDRRPRRRSSPSSPRSRSRWRRQRRHEQEAGGLQDLPPARRPSAIPVFTAERHRARRRRRRSSATRVTYNGPTEASGREAGAVHRHRRPAGLQRDHHLGPRPERRRAGAQAGAARRA